MILDNVTVKLGKEYWEKGDLPTALVVFFKCIELNYKNAEALQVARSIYKDIKDFDGVIASLNTWLEREPDNATLLFVRGDLERRKEDYPASLKSLNLCLEKKRNYPLALGRRGAVYQELGDVRSALADYKACLALEPLHTFARKSRGDYFRCQGRYTEALDDLGLSLSIDSEDPFPYITRGVYFHCAGRLKEALDDYNNAIRIDSDDAFSYMARGKLYIKTGDRDKALADLNTALRLKPNDLEALLCRSTLQVNKDDAIADLELSLTFDSKNVEALVLCAERYRAQGSFEKALDYFNQCLGIQPMYAAALRGRCAIFLKQDELSQSDLERLLGDINNSFVSESTHVFGYYLRGEVNRRLGHLDQALADFNESLRLRGGDVRARTGRAEVYIETEKFELAQKEAALLLSFPYEHSQYFGNKLMEKIALAQGNLNKALCYNYRKCEFRTEMSSLFEIARHSFLQNHDELALRFQANRCEYTNEQLDKMLSVLIYSGIHPEAVHAVQKFRWIAIGDRESTFPHLVGDEHLSRGLSRCNLMTRFMLLERGKRHLEGGEYNCAALDFTSVLKMDVNCIEAHLGRGEAYLGVDNYAAAFDDFNKCLVLDNLAAAYRGRGEVYKSGAKFLDKALADFSKSLELEPDNTVALFARGVIFNQTGKPVAALADFSRCLELKPGHRSAFENCAEVFSKFQKVPKASLTRNDEYVRFESFRLIEKVASSLMNFEDALRYGYQKCVSKKCEPLSLFDSAKHSFVNNHTVLTQHFTADRSGYSTEQLKKMLLVLSRSGITSEAICAVQRDRKLPLSETQATFPYLVRYEYQLRLSDNA